MSEHWLFDKQNSPLVVIVGEAAEASPFRDDERKLERFFQFHFCFSLHTLHSLCRRQESQRECLEFLQAARRED